jgi:nitrogen fixation protein FixH
MASTNPRIDFGNSDAPRRRAPAWRWPAIIIGLLVAHTTLMTTAAMIATHRPGESAVIPDYYNKAQAWDAYKYQLAQADKLGWKIELEPTGKADVLGHKQMRLSLTDAADKPITGAIVSVHCYHLSHGDEAATVSATAASAGSYELTLPAQRQGFWQFDITATSGSQTFVKSVTRWID